MIDNTVKYVSPFSVIIKNTTHEMVKNLDCSYKVPNQNQQAIINYISDPLLCTNLIE